MDQAYTLKSSLANLEKISHLTIREISCYNPQTQSSLAEYNYFDQSIFFDSSTQIIYLNINIAHKCQDIFKNFLIHILKNTTSSEIIINFPGLTMPEIVDCLIANSNLKKAYFTTYLPRFTLTPELLQKLKSRNIIAYVPTFTPSLKNSLNKDFFISVNFYETAKYRELNVASLLAPIQPDKFSYLLTTTKVIIDFQDIENTIQILTFLKNNNYKGIIQINIFKGFNITSLSDFSKHLNIIICDTLFDKANFKDQSTIDEYNKIKKQLQSMLSPLDNSNLTPFEKYIFLYNIVKNYKKYKENHQDDADSRSIYNIIDSDYMVCSGYANLLTNLCELANIPCTYITCEVGKLKVPDELIQESITRIFPSFISHFINRHKSLYRVIETFINSDTKKQVYNKDGHARVYINITDPVYGIDGYYYSDPTWDSTKTFDYYTHLIFTDKENSQAVTPFYFDIMALFDITNSNEFWEKLKYLKRDNDIHRIIKEFLIIFISIDYTFFKELSNKYGFNENSFFPEDYNQDTINAILNDICNHILKKVNKPISKDIKYTAIKNYLFKMQIIPNVLLDYYMYILKYFNNLEDHMYFDSKIKRK